MKLLLLSVMICYASINLAQSVYDKHVMTLREEKNEELRGKKTSPLQRQDRKAFDHLNYFSIDSTYRLQARFEKSSHADTIDIPTSAGTVKMFEAYGTLEFQLNDQTLSLTAYKRIWPNGINPYADHESLFVPFTDLTTGNLCYGGGRYMDIPVPSQNGEVELDFNTCYNPYCAYGSGFSCPIPPKENFLNLEIKAGEMAYDSH